MMRSGDKESVGFTLFMDNLCLVFSRFRIFSLRFAPLARAKILQQRLHLLAQAAFFKLFAAAARAWIVSACRYIAHDFLF
jgi:hypothetical protein